MALHDEEGKLVGVVSAVSQTVQRRYWRVEQRAAEWQAEWAAEQLEAGSRAASMVFLVVRRQLWCRK